MDKQPGRPGSKAPLGIPRVGVLSVLTGGDLKGTWNVRTVSSGGRRRGGTAGTPRPAGCSDRCMKTLTQGLAVSPSKEVYKPRAASEAALYGEKRTGLTGEAGLC